MVFAQPAPLTAPFATTVELTTAMLEAVMSDSFEPGQPHAPSVYKVALPATPQTSRPVSPALLALSSTQESVFFVPSPAPLAHPQ